MIGIVSDCVHGTRRQAVTAGAQAWHVPRLYTVFDTSLQSC